MENDDKKDRQISTLEYQNNNLTIYLGIACIVAVVLGIFLYSAYAAIANRDDMLGTCVSEVSALNDSVSSMNDTLDSISTDASNASGDDYDSQSSTLYDISNEASAAKSSNDQGSSSCSQISSNDSYDSGN